MQDKFHKMKPGDHVEQHLKIAGMDKSSKLQTPEEELIGIEEENSDFWKFTAKNDQEISEQLKLLRQSRAAKRQSTSPNTDVPHVGASKKSGKNPVRSIALV
ncbi:hypothetical protein Y032_0004g1805 [Ancylostoma ceylanicum]|nr:hypothetical protein Y032_0004g1805 [Ancylostoma ceylanicum]